MDERLIERVARVLGEAMEGITPKGWDKQPETLKSELRDGAAAVLLYLHGEGWAPPGVMDEPSEQPKGELPIAVRVWRSQASEE